MQHVGAHTRPLVNDGLTWLVLVQVGVIQQIPPHMDIFQLLLTLSESRVSGKPVQDAFRALYATHGISTESIICPSKVQSNAL